MGEFKNFLLNESKIYLGQRIGDILNALHTLNDEGKHMGQRQMVKHAERIGSMIRRILHSSWPKRDTHHLQGLQKVGVSILKAVEEKGDLDNVLVSGARELEKVLSDMGTPINQIGDMDKQNPTEKEKNVDKPEHKRHQKSHKDNDKKGDNQQQNSDKNNENDPGQQTQMDDIMPQVQPPPPNGQGPQVL